MALSQQEKNRRQYERRPDKNRFAGQYEANRKIILATQSTCAICGKIVDKTLKSPDPLSATIDHIIPIAKGGHPAAIENLQLTHRACNRRKGTKILLDEKPKVKNVFIHSKDWRFE